jgi:hypothetical protein
LSRENTSPLMPPLPLSTIAYGCVVITAVVLFSIGTPGERSRSAVGTTATAMEAKNSAAAVIPSSVAGGGTTLHSVNVEFPASDRTFPGGATADAINNNCLSCHSAGMVLTQPTMPRVAWQAKVASMRNNYKAPVAEVDVAAIVDYLTNLSQMKEPR